MWCISYDGWFVRIPIEKCQDVKIMRLSYSGIGILFLVKCQCQTFAFCFTKMYSTFPVYLNPSTDDFSIKFNGFVFRTWWNQTQIAGITVRIICWVVVFWLIPDFILLNPVVNNEQSNTSPSVLRFWWWLSRTLMYWHGTWHMCFTSR